MVYGYVYIIKNNVNDKLYVGQTINPATRRRAHFARTASCGSMPIKRAIRKYGRKHFDFILLEDCCSREELDAKEIYWIKSLNTISPNGYNLTEGGNSNLPGEETRRKMGACQKGRKLSIEHKQRISKAMGGRRKSAETRKKMSANSAYRNKTHCPQGHLLDNENTCYRTRKDGRIYRRCRTCVRESNRKTYYRRKKREAGEV